MNRQSTHSRRALFATVLVLTGVLGILLVRSLDTTPVEPIAGGGAVAESAEVGPSGSGRSVSQADRVESALSQSPQNSPHAPIHNVQSAVDVAGIAYTLDGLPLSGAQLFLSRNAQSSAITSERGEFRFVGSNGAQLRDVTCAAHVLVRYSEVGETRTSLEQVLVFAPAVSLAGRVINEAGHPVAGAEISVEMAQEAYSAFIVGLEQTRQNNWSSRAGLDGLFAITAPCGQGIALVCKAVGYESATITVPGSDTANLELRLGRLGVLRGKVELHDGHPAVGAVVRLDRCSAKADHRGEFTLPLDRPIDPQAPLIAGLKGMQVAVLPEFGKQVADGQFVVLRLGPAALTISGRVVDAMGAPCVGWSLEVLGGIEISKGRIPPAYAEDLGASAPPQGKTNGLGEFHFDGLRSAAYRIRAWNRDTLQSTISPEVQAGSQNLTIVVSGKLRERLLGYVRLADGAPVEGARVRLSRVVYESGGAVSHATGQTVATAADGRFELTQIPEESLLLRVDGRARSGDLVPVEVQVPEEGNLSPIIVTAHRYAQLAIELPGAKAGSVEITDSTGKRLLIHGRQLGVTTSSFEWPVKNGRTGVLSVSEVARELVIRDASREVVRRQITVSPGSVAIIR